ncbi:hypothetical protein [Actinokineospora sp. NBRC 105648]|uniref:hypothetical protein n=1 Tax=Actinokineospora sp. NBRC 105648 TaxID=3032206 RepID=UPI0024A01349|nr:hypothetical protein [Actinokineospora sp. NBRC 105648]GLZ41944.1 hypothetical protein Acsp05_55680 [Actinokineospora sp. NBRC 105648]
MAPRVIESDRLDPGGWATVGTQRAVLAVVHNVTAATRLLDVLDLVADDDRVRVAFTIPGTSAFTAGTEQFLVDRGMAVRPWDSAADYRADLVISASLGGRLRAAGTPLVVLPHGMGYNKFLDTESGNGNAVFGLSPEWLLDDQGRLIPDVLVLSHEEQRARLARSCPPAVGVSVVAGDPCLDRMVASGPLRGVYRRALGVRAGQRLVVLSSTWGPDSLFALGAGLVERFAGLAVDGHRVVLALHPNIRAWHSPWQVDRWLARCARAGVALLPPDEGWRAALVAADVVVGDHGSVTFYGAALGRPVLLATAPAHTVAADSPIGRFLAVAPRLTASDLADQLDAAVGAHRPGALAGLTDLATSVPDRSAAVLRSELYRAMDLPEPAHPVQVRAVPVPRTDAAEPGAQLVRVDRAVGRAVVTRYAAVLLAAGGPLPEGTHLVVDTEEPTRRELELAEIVVAPDPALAADLLRRLPGCALATAPVAADSWEVLTRAGERVRVDGLGEHGRVGASLVHQWLCTQGPLATLPDRLSVHCGAAGFDVTFWVVP